MVCALSHYMIYSLISSTLRLPHCLSSVECLTCISQVFSSGNPLPDGRTDCEDDRPRRNGSRNRHVYAHCDHWPANPQFIHPVPHLFCDHTEESLQFYGWSTPTSHHRLWDFIKVILDSKYTPLQTHEQWWNVSFLYVLYGFSSQFCHPTCYPALYGAKSQH